MFNRDSTKNSGIRSECKKCESIARKKKYYDNPGSDFKRKTKYYEKYKARVALYNAIYLGNVERKPCEVCGSNKVHGHHEDYSKPLDVKWLCVEHHTDRHREIRASQNNHLR